MEKLKEKDIPSLKEQIKKDLEEQVRLKITESSTRDFLLKILSRCEEISEILELARFGQLYKRTGFVYDPISEKTKDSIFYFKEDSSLSFYEKEEGKKEDPNLLIIGDNYKALLT